MTYVRHLAACAAFLAATVTSTPALAGEEPAAPEKTTSVTELSISGLYVAEDVSADRPVVIGDSLPASDVPLVAGASSKCGGRYAGWAPPLAWATYKWTRCSLAGSAGYKKPYSWYVDAFSSGSACGKGLGYDSKKKALWRSLGCGKKGSTRVPWGNVLGIPKYKTTSQMVPLGTPTWWN